MKIRNGLVSNSSSSSFLIAAKEISEEKILEALNVPKESPLSPIANSIASFFYHETLRKERSYTTVEEYAEEFGYDLDDVPEDVKQLFNSGYKIWTVWACNDSDDPIETMLYYADLNIKTSDLFVIQR